MPFDKEVLTTGEVAKVCNVAPRTVSKWFDSGALPGYRIPGSKDRRIPLANLLIFMKQHGIPMDALNTGRTRVVIVDDERDVVDVLKKVLTEQTSYEVFTAVSAFEAGALCERIKPHVVLLDVHLGDSDARAIAEMIRGNEALSMTKIIAMSGKLTDGQVQSMKSLGYAGFLRKPFQVRQVVEAIESATSVVY